MALQALTVSDFRAMIGTSDYGEVRLAANGGLEKVNQHFLQRLGIRRATVDRNESTFIARSLIDALSGKVSADCLRTIRGKLGLSLMDNIDLERKPLTCRAIRLIFEIVDKDGSDVNALSESDLKTAINDYNKTKQGNERINLGSDELKVLSRRHGVELAKKINGEGGQVALIEAIKDIVNRKENLKGGATALGLSGVRAQRADITTVVNNAVNRQGLALRVQTDLGMRGERLDAIENWEQNRPNVMAAKSIEELHKAKGGHRQLLTEGEPFLKKDFVLKDFAGLEFSKDLTAMDKKENQDLKKDVFAAEGKLNDALADRILNYMAEKYAGNITRNKINCSIGDQVISTSWDDNGITDAKEKNKDMIRDVGQKLRKQHPQMTPPQLAASFRVFNQTAYSVFKSFGITFFHFDNMCKFSFDGDDVKVNFRFRPNASAPSSDAEAKQGMGPFRWEFRIDKDGMMQTEYLGKDEEPPFEVKPTAIP